MPASTPETANEAVITVFARTPIMRVIVKSSDDARMARPRTDLRRKRLRPASATSVVRIVAMSSQCTTTPPICSVDCVKSGMLIVSGRGPRHSSRALWMIRLRPSEVSSSVTGGASRTGRNAMRSISTAATAPVRIAIGMNVSHGQPALAASSIAKPDRVSTSPCAKLISPTTANTAATPIASSA